MKLRGFKIFTGDSSRAERVVFFASLALNSLLWVAVLVLFPKSSPTTILHYTAGVGIDFVGEGWQIVTLPAMGTLLIIVNVVLARLVLSASSYAFWVLWLAMPMLQVLLIVTYGILFGLNT